LNFQRGCFEVVGWVKWVVRYVEGVVIEMGVLIDVGEGG